MTRCMLILLFTIVLSVIEMSYSRHTLVIDKSTGSAKNAEKDGIRIKRVVFNNQKPVGPFQDPELGIVEKQGLTSLDSKETSSNIDIIENKWNPVIQEPYNIKITQFVDQPQTNTKNVNEQYLISKTSEGQLTGAGVNANNNKLCDMKIKSNENFVLDIRKGFEEENVLRKDCLIIGNMESVVINKTSLNEETNIRKAHQSSDSKETQEGKVKLSIDTDSTANETAFGSKTQNNQKEQKPIDVKLNASTEYVQQVINKPNSERENDKPIVVPENETGAQNEKKSTKILGESSASNKNKIFKIPEAHDVPSHGYHYTKFSQNQLKDHGHHGDLQNHLYGYEYFDHPDRFHGGYQDYNHEFNHHHLPIDKWNHDHDPHHFDYYFYNPNRYEYNLPYYI